jgi:hypothetical protein
VAKWSRAQDQFVRLTAIADLLQALHKQGVPVAPPLTSVDAQHRVTIDSGSSPLSMTVQPQIDGDLLDTTNETAVRQAGACLATLHLALAIHRDSRLSEVEPRQSLDLCQRIETWLELEDAGTAPTASATLRDQIASLPQIDSEPQLIQNDYRASNVLMADSEILAVIDFDGVAASTTSRTHSSCSAPASPTGSRHQQVFAPPFSTGTNQCDHSPGSNTNGSKHSCSGAASKPSQPVMTQPDGQTLCRTPRPAGFGILSTYSRCLHGSLDSG